MLDNLSLNKCTQEVMAGNAALVLFIMNDTKHLHYPFPLHMFLVFTSPINEKIDKKNVSPYFRLNVNIFMI